MRDYAKLVKGLRYAFEQPCYDCVLGEKCNWGDFCFFKIAADAIEELLAKVPTWISVEERLPEELPHDDPGWSESVRPSKDVQVYVKSEKRITAAWYSFVDRIWCTVDEMTTYITGDVTHWSEQPALPNGVE